MLFELLRNSRAWNSRETHMNKIIKTDRTTKQVSENLRPENMSLLSLKHGIDQTIRNGDRKTCLVLILIDIFRFLVFV